MLSSINLFIAFMLFMLIYGAFLKIWKQSRTSYLVVCAITIIAFSSKFVSTDCVLLEMAVVMFMLFVRAVFRKYLQKDKRLKEIFYA